MQDATGSGDEVQKKKVEEEEDEDDDEDDEEALVPLAEMKLAKFELLPSTLLHQEFLHVRKEKGAVAVPVCTNETPDEDRLDDLGGDPNAAAAEAMGTSLKEASRSSSSSSSHTGFAGRAGHFLGSLFHPEAAGGVGGADSGSGGVGGGEDVDLSAQFLGKVELDSSETLAQGASVFLCLVTSPSASLEVRATNSAMVFFSWPALTVEVIATSKENDSTHIILQVFIFYFIGSYDLILHNI